MRTHFEVQRKIEVISDPLFPEHLGATCSRHASNINNLPAMRIIDPSHDGNSSVFPKDQLNFCYRAVLMTIDSCLSGRYSDFDGHTTSNCCHGMAMLACRLISSVLQLDLKSLYHEGEKMIDDLENYPEKAQLCKWWIPESLVNLSSLYLLGTIKEVDVTKGNRTETKKLKSIAPISTNACIRIAKSLQKQFSNLIADTYDDYFEEGDPGMLISGAPVEMWGRYIGPDYIRMDKRGVKYASNLFSMQVMMAHLIRSRAKVVLINDILDISGNLQGRYVVIFQGDGEGMFQVLSSEDVKFLSLFKQSEPVVVFGGLVYSDHFNVDSLSLQMQPWLDKLPNLLLACDVFYPQFCKVIDDPEFDSCPITPNEELLRTIMNDHLNIQGVSATDPSLYCAAHIYPACLNQVLNVLNCEDEYALPVSFVPEVKLNSQFASSVS